MSYQALLVFIALLAVSLASYVLSYTTDMTRGVQVFTLCWGLLTASLFIGRFIRGHPLRIVITGIIVLLLISWACFAGRPPDRTQLRRAYISRLLAYQGTFYLWGGETHIGIDCSGLAREALCEAMLTRGIAEANPRLLGPQYWRFWWQDLSARGMLAGTNGYSRVVGGTEKIAGYSGEDLLPGDLAVVGSGYHVLIYLGNSRWIQASPDQGKVAIGTATADAQDGWFHMPVTFVRWKMLE
ncbi:MAG TPA: NlpC/P60 family protein [Armatimonadota bacterium]